MSSGPAFIVRFNAEGAECDSRTVFFASDRSGNFDVYRQSIDEQTAQPVISGPEDELGVKLSPDGASYFYAIPVRGWRSTITRPLTWLRAPSTGGAPQAIFPGPVAGIIDCARAPSRTCVYGEGKAGQLVLSLLDAGKGLGTELTRVNADRWYRFGLSPDGTRVALALRDRLRIISLDSKRADDVFVTGWTGFDSVSWAAEGEAFYLTSQPPGRTVLLHVDLHGQAQPLFEMPEVVESVVLPSPDGKRLAFGRWSSPNNAWMVEGL